MMRAMFLEAEIAQNFELDCNKIECHKVWSKKILPKHMSGVKSANLSTVCLDESLNDISNRKEMDSHLLYDICAEN